MPRNLKKRGRIWWYRINKDGVPYEGSLQTDQLGVAKERLETKRRELTASNFGERPRRTFDEAALKFQSVHYKKLKPKSRLRYTVSLVNLADMFHGVFLEDVGSALLSDFVEARLDTGVEESTVIRDLACLSSVFSKAEEWEWVDRNPVKPFKRKCGLKEGAAGTRYLSVIEEPLVLQHAPTGAVDPIIFAIESGLRKEEQFSLTRADLNLAANEITVRAEIAKNGLERKVPITDRCLEVIQRLPAAIGASPVFVTKDGERYSPNSPTLYEALQKACRRAGVPPCSWHDLRRTCGCRLLLERHFSMEEVSVWLGHADIKITQKRYAFLKIEKLHQALARGAVLVPFPKRAENKTERT
jgi:integrase